MRFLFIYLWLLYPQCYLNDIIAKTTDIVCKPNDKYVEGTKCSVQTLSLDNSVGQMDCFLKEPLRNPKLNLQFMKRDKFKRYQPFLANISITLCDILSKKNKVLTNASGFWETLRKYTNVNHSCPYSGHLFARNITIEAEYIPPGLTNGAFLIVLNFMESFSKRTMESFGIINWYFEIMQKKDRVPKTKKGG